MDKHPTVYSTQVHFNWVREEWGRITAWNSYGLQGNPNKSECTMKDGCSKSKIFSRYLWEVRLRPQH